jgi:tRNA/tmRNA/rRNA uracil-C5-methylase (TrmA/RlmC/RlmD family)
VTALLDLTVGPVAHGGHCVARDASGQVVFVRHALPGERVRAAVTERRRGYLRADAVEVLVSSPERVEPPCPYAGPGRCGGCDFQHARPQAQRELKAAVVREQLVRLAGLSPAEVERLDVRVAPLSDDPLGWRTRVRYTVDASGWPGFHRHRSTEVMPVHRCLIAHPAIQALDVTERQWRSHSVEAVTTSEGDIRVFTSSRDAPVVAESAVRRQWTLAADVFWQVHPAAPDTFAAAVLDLLQPRAGERAWDLYGGAGLFAAALAGSLGVQGRVTVVESDPRAVAAARRSLADLPQVRVVAAPVARALANPRWRAVDLVVLDPPRSGAGADVVHAIADRRPRAVAYVACDPAAFARDVATFRALGWRLAALRAYDAFPMTHHVECVGLLAPAED